MYCDRLYAELIGGRPDSPRDCREHELSTAQMIDVSLSDRIVFLDKQPLIQETGSCRLNRKSDGGQLSLDAAVLILAAREEASSLALLPLAGAQLVPAPFPTEAACIGPENVLVLLREDRLAVPMLKLGLSPLELLNHPRGEMNPPIPILYSGKDGLLEMKKGPDVK